MQNRTRVKIPYMPKKSLNLRKGKGRNMILRHVAEIVRLGIWLGFNIQYEERKF